MSKGEFDLKTIKFLTVIILLTSVLCSNVSAIDCEKINWFFKSKGEDTQPEILGGSDILKKHTALFLGNENEKTVYLTFDAGYSNENVEKILEILEKQNVKAAFFILPGIIKNSKDTVQKMIDGGHLICNHTKSHADMAKITDIEKFKEELVGLEEIYRNEFSKEMEKYFRPPEGSFSEKTLEFCEELGYTPVFWSFAYADWDNGKQPTPEKAKQKIFSSIHNGMVILLHPTSETNALILDEVITELKNRGFSFGTLDELKSACG